MASGCAGNGTAGIRPCGNSRFRATQRLMESRLTDPGAASRADTVLRASRAPTAERHRGRSPAAWMNAGMPRIRVPDAQFPAIEWRTESSRSRSWRFAQGRCRRSLRALSNTGRGAGEAIALAPAISVAHMGHGLSRVSAMRIELAAFRPIWGVARDAAQQSRLSENFTTALPRCARRANENAGEGESVMAIDGRRP